MQSSPERPATGSDPDLDLELDGCIEAFEAAVARGPADPVDFLPPIGHPKYLLAMCELVRVDLEFAWDRGDERLLEEYRDRFPQLFSNPSHLRAIASEEFRLRCAAGEEPDPGEYQTRFGIDLRAEANVEPRATHVVNLDPVTVWSGAAAPCVGDVIPPGFVLESELGTGTFGRVFLARQAELAGRAVAVKLSTRMAGESQILARLQHTNIVPIYSIHRVGAYHALVMPFLGRSTLANLIDAFRHSGEQPASGMEVVSTLANLAAGTAQSNGQVNLPDSRPGSSASGLSQSILNRLSQMGFVEAVLWIGAELADGLAHAHDRGVLHRDIKPANVLITDDGRPMLLDFNLATDRDEPAVGGGLGGTIRYMAPEQLATIRMGRSQHSVQSDVYALGLILTELLAGRLPFDEPGGALDAVVQRMLDERRRPLDLSRLPKGVSPAVRSILTKSLSPNRADRYASATDLKDDLVRQLENRPLKHASDPSVTERLRKWARRHPRLSSATSLGSIAAMALLVITTAFLARQRHMEVLEAERARDDLRAAVTMAYTANGPATELRDIRDVVHTALAPYHIESADWTSEPIVRRLNEGDQAAVRQDAAVVMGLAARLTARLAANEADAVRAQSLRDDAQAWHERSLQTAPSSTRESTLEAWVGGRLVEKVHQLRSLARTGEPRFATWMTLGTVEAKLGNHAKAIEAFTAASGMSTRFPWPYFHRGISRLEAKEFSDAKADFDRFLELRPNDADAYFNRGNARLHLGDTAGAVSDLNEAERLGLSLNRLYVLRGRAKRQQGDSSGAQQDQRMALAVVPTDARSWTVRGEMKLDAQPADYASALSDFDQAIQVDPNFLPALRNKASVLAENLNRPSDALIVIDRLLELVPDASGDRAGRAVVLARLGRKLEARRDAEAIAQSDSALILYQAASAVLLAAEGEADRTRGLSLLRSVLRKDPTWARTMLNDPDLRSVHSHPTFRELLTAANVLARKD
ncbi:MAG: protein kinase [Gemmataceae bacterium]